MSPRTLIAAMLLVAGLAATAHAHYLWVASDKSTVNIYFEEGPAPGDGGYLDPFVKASQTWIRTPEQKEPQALAAKEVTKDKNRWLAAELPHAAPRSIDCYGKFGVYRYGTTDVLLHYYARHLDVSTHDEMHALARAENLHLDIVPHDHEGEVQLTVLWKGKPAADRPVYIRGPKGFNQTPKTDAKGIVTFKPDAAGRYLFRTSVDEDKGGEDDGKAYSLTRHNATMMLTLPLK